MENLHESNRDSDGYAVFLNHDLSMLRLIEAFAESAPQLVLMLTIILHQSQFDPVTGRENKLQSGLTRRKPPVLQLLHAQDPAEGFCHISVQIQKESKANLNIAYMWFLNTSVAGWGSLTITHSTADLLEKHDF